MTTLQRDQLELLRADLPASAVKTRKAFGDKGAELSYIEAWQAIHSANEILGYDAWSCETRTLEETSREKAKDKYGKDQWQVSFVATVRVTFGNIVRDGTGYGSGYARQVGEAIEGACKEAESDALKRALRTFGNQFGLALYDKTQANVEGTPANEQKKANEGFDVTVWERKIDEAKGKGFVAIGEVGEQIKESITSGAIPESARAHLRKRWSDARAELETSTEVEVPSEAA